MVRPALKRAITERSVCERSVWWCSIFGRPILKRPAMALIGAFLLVQPAMAVDPPYQEEMERLLTVMGNLYFLQPLCGFKQADWRQNADELIKLDEPVQDRQQRLSGAFNEGYEAYSRLYRSCTQSGKLAMARLLGEADHLARDIHSRYAE